MHLPIAKIIWHKSDSSGAHNNHLHVEGIPRLIGYNTGVGEQPPAKNPGMTDSVWAIYVALSEKFGEPAYMKGGDWNHMGWYNRRTIGGKTQWSQHAWSNAIDIGPYWFGDQQRFYDFLTGTHETKGEEDMPVTIEDADLIINRLFSRAMKVDSPDAHRAFETVIRGIRFDSQKAHQYAKSNLGRLANVLNAVEAIDTEPIDAAALVAEVVNAIEEQGIAKAVADEIDKRNRARLNVQ